MECLGSVEECILVRFQSDPAKDEIVLNGCTPFAKLFIDTVFDCILAFFYSFFFFYLK